MNTFKESDFAEMLFPFYRVSKNLLTAYPKLAELYRDIPEYNEKRELIPGQKYIPKDNVILYVGYAYDKGSPLQKIESLVERKVQAALLSGFEANEKGEFADDVNKIFQCKHIGVNEMIVRYCRLMRSRLYSVIVAGNETLHFTIKQLLNQASDDDDGGNRLTLLKKVREDAKAMDELFVDFLRDENKRLHEHLYLVTNNMIQYLDLTCEDYSQKEHKRPVLKGES